MFEKIVNLAVGFEGVLRQIANPESQHAACAKWTFLEPKMQNKTNNNHPPRVQTEHTGICLHTPRVQTEHTGILLHTPRVQTEHTGIFVAHAAAPGGGWVGCFLAVVARARTT